MRHERLLTSSLSTSFSPSSFSGPLNIVFSNTRLFFLPEYRLYNVFNSGEDICVTKQAILFVIRHMSFIRFGQRSLSRQNYRAVSQLLAGHSPALCLTPFTCI